MKKTLRILVIFTHLLIILNFIGCSSQEQVVEQNYSKALELAAEKNYSKAKEILKECISESPKEGKYDFALGNICREMQDLEKAKSFYLVAIEKSPKLKEAYNNLAGIYMIEQKFDMALTTVDKGLEHEADFDELNFKKAQLVFIKKDYQEVIEILNKLQSPEKYPDSDRFKGLAYYFIGDKEQATQCLVRYLEKKPNGTRAKEQIQDIVDQLQGDTK